MKKQWYLAATAGLTLGLSTLAMLHSPVWAETFTAPTIAPVVDTLLAAGTETSSTTYKVVLGDTLYGISRKKGLSLADLIALNRDTVPDPDLILVGQILQLGPSELSTPPDQDIQGQSPVSPPRTRRHRHPHTKSHAKGPSTDGQIVSVQPTPKVSPPKTKTTPTAVQPTTRTAPPSSRSDLRSDLSKKTLVVRKRSGLWPSACSLSVLCGCADVAWFWEEILGFVPGYPDPEE